MNLLSHGARGDAVAFGESISMSPKWQCKDGVTGALGIYRQVSDAIRAAVYFPPCAGYGKLDTFRMRRYPGAISFLIG